MNSTFNKAHSDLPALLIPFLAIALLLGACAPADQRGDQCNKNDYITETGARHLVSLPLPITPGPVVTVQIDQDQVYRAASGGMWLSSDGTELYLLDAPNLWRVDLASWEMTLAASPGEGARRLGATPDDDLLLVTDSERGKLTVIDNTQTLPTVQVPVGEGVRSVAVGPGSRIAYVTNPEDRSISMVDTGVGERAIGDCLVIVACEESGDLLVLNGDGYTKQHFPGLPGGIAELSVSPDGRHVIASYSDLFVSGQPDVTGDGELVLEEGVVVLDLHTGEQTRYVVTAPESAPANVRANPQGLALLDGGNRVAVALPGWTSVAVIDLQAGPAEAISMYDLPGRAKWLAAGTLEGDWLYALDSEVGVVWTLDPAGKVVSTVGLR